MSRILTIGALRRFLNTLPLDVDHQEIHIFEDDGNVMLTEIGINPDQSGIIFYRYGDEPCEDDEPTND